MSANYKSVWQVVPPWPVEEPRVEVPQLINPETSFRAPLPTGAVEGKVVSGRQMAKPENWLSRETVMTWLKRFRGPVDVRTLSVEFNAQRVRLERRLLGMTEDGAVICIKKESPYRKQIVNFFQPAETA